MKSHAILITGAAAIALCGCGGSDVGAPAAVSPVASNSVSVAPSVDSVALAPTFVVRVSEGEAAQSFVVKITDAATLAKARRLLSDPLEPHQVLAGDLLPGDGGFNRDPKTGRAYSWHMAPSSVRFVDSSIEIYDGRPSDIEGDLPYWLSKMGHYTPWANHFEREIAKPKGR